MRNIFLLLLFFITACAPKLPEFPPEHFNKEINIYACKSINLEGYGIFNSYQVIRFKDWYVFDDRDNEAGIKLLSLDGKRSLGGISQGNGPFDVVGAYEIWCLGDSLVINDYNHRKMLGVDVIEDSLVCRLIPYANNSFHAYFAVNGNRFVECAHPSHPYFCRLKDYQNNIYSVLPMPSDGYISELPQMNQFSLYLNTLFAFSPDKTKYAWAVRHFPYYSFGRIVADSLYVDRSLFYDKVKIGNIDDDGIAIPSNDNSINVLSATSSDLYAIFLYSDNVYADAIKFSGNCILCYSWDGTPVFMLKTKERLRYINYDNERKRLFGITEDPFGFFVEYDMNGILD